MDLEEQELEKPSKTPYIILVVFLLLLLTIFFFLHLYSFAPDAVEAASLPSILALSRQAANEQTQNQNLLLGTLFAETLNARERQLEEIENVRLDAYARYRSLEVFAPQSDQNLELPATPALRDVATSAAITSQGLAYIGKFTILNRLFPRSVQSLPPEVYLDLDHEEPLLDTRNSVNLYYRCVYHGTDGDLVSPASPLLVVNEHDYFSRNFQLTYLEQAQGFLSLVKEYTTFFREFTNEAMANDPDLPFDRAKKLAQELLMEVIERGIAVQEQLQQQTDFRNVPENRQNRRQIRMYYTRLAQAFRAALQNFGMNIPFDRKVDEFQPLIVTLPPCLPFTQSGQPLPIDHNWSRFVYAAFGTPEFPSYTGDSFLVAQVSGMSVTQVAVNAVPLPDPERPQAPSAACDA